MNLKTSAALISLAGLTFGCSSQKESRNWNAISSEVVNLNNGVYVFPYKDFPTTLLKFRENNPQLRVTAIVKGPYDPGIGRNIGSNIVVRTEKK